MQDTEFPGDVYEGQTQVDPLKFDLSLVLDGQREREQLKTHSAWPYSQ